MDSYISVYALTLATHIELVVKNYFKEFAKKISDDIIVAAIEEIKVLNINEALKPRIIGFLSNIRGEIRAKDILNELVKNDEIASKQLNYWNKLRNSSTHGDNLNMEFQELFNLCSANLVLYYNLIFILINYTGSYSDYSTYGYPILNFKRNKA
jgi:hypothetical protein